MRVAQTSSLKRRRLLRLEDGNLIVLPTNIYKQAGGVKLDLSLGGFRIDGEKCTLKNRAFNFGVLQGFTRENLLALRCAALCHWWTRGAQYPPLASRFALVNV